VSASSAENPDSFEVHKFIVSTTTSHTREEPNLQRKTQPDLSHQQHYQADTHKQQSQHIDYGAPTDQTNIPKMLEDAVAGSIRSQQDQFADLHNRIQIINNRVFEMYELMEKIHGDNEQRFVDLMNRVVPIHDRSAATIRNVEKVERTTMEILRDLESKDFKDMMNQIHRALENNQEGLSNSLPLLMGTGTSFAGLV
jgi:mannose-binding lectin 1